MEEFVDGATSHLHYVNKPPSVKSKRPDPETPIAFRKICECSEGEFSGFIEEGSNMKRMVTVEKEIRCLRELVAGILEKQDQLIEENEKLKRKCGDLERTVQLNEEVKITLEELKKENSTLKVKCNKYEAALEGLREKVDTKVETVEGAVSETKLEEMRKAWKKEQEDEKVNFAEVVKQQIQEKTKDAVIKVIKEKEDLVRDTVDKKKCLVFFGVQEKKNPVKFVREKEEKEVVKKLISVIQDEEQGLEKEIEEVYRLGKYSEGSKRPLKVKMRSQVGVEEILARTGKLAGNSEYSQIWIKRDMSQEEREKERELRNEAKVKNERRTETEKKKFYWRVLDMKLRKWYIREGEGVQ